MKKFVAIGLGNFGLSVAKTLEDNGCEVLGIDTSKNTVNYAKEFLTHVLIGDASNREVLESLSLRDFDGAIVSIGQDMASSILISLYLKEIGVKNIIVRAVSEDHGKILTMIGVAEVVFPEQDMGIRMGNRLASKNVMDYLPLGEDYGIIELTPPAVFLGKNLKELEIRPRYNCQVIGIKYLPVKNGKPGSKTDREKIIIAPSADELITEKSIMILIGKMRDLERLQNQS